MPAANTNDMRRYLLNPIEPTPLGPSSAPDRARSPTALPPERLGPISQSSSPRHEDTDPPVLRPLPAGQESHVGRKSPFLALAMAIAHAAFGPALERRRNQHRRSQGEHRSSRGRRTHGGSRFVLSFPELPADPHAGEFPSVTTSTDTGVLPTERDIAKDMNVAGSLSLRHKDSDPRVRRPLPAARGLHAGMKSPILALAMAIALTFCAPLAVLVGLVTADWLNGNDDRAYSERSADGAATQAASPVTERASLPVRPSSVMGPAAAPRPPHPGGVGAWAQSPALPAPLDLPSSKTD
jgi:hypothetical protein